MTFPVYFRSRAAESLSVDFYTWFQPVVLMSNVITVIRASELSPLACTPYVPASLSNPIVVTQVWTETTPMYFGRDVVALTTFYTPRPECLDKWLLETAWTAECGTRNPGSVRDFTVFSAYAGYDPWYNQCLLYGTRFYSPGICPHGQTIADVTEFQSSASTGYHTFWHGSCCRRFVLTFCLLRRKHCTDDLQQVV